MRPVNLDRLLAEAEVHGLPLARRQARYPAADLRSLRVGEPPLPVDLEPFPDAVEEQLAADRLLEEIEGAGPHGARRRRHVAVAADDDDGQGQAAGDERVLEVDAAQPRHAEVDDEAARPAAVLRLEELL